MTIVEIENVTKTFGQHVAVNRLSLSVPRGSIYGFIAPNGSGKTTTLRMIMASIIRIQDQASFVCLGKRTPSQRTIYTKK